MCHFKCGTHFHHIYNVVHGMGTIVRRPSKKAKRLSDNKNVDIYCGNDVEDRKLQYSNKRWLEWGGFIWWCQSANTCNMVQSETEILLVPYVWIDNTFIHSMLPRRNWRSEKMNEGSHWLSRHRIWSTRVGTCASHAHGENNTHAGSNCIPIHQFLTLSRSNVCIYVVRDK